MISCSQASLARSPPFLSLPFPPPMFIFPVFLLCTLLCSQKLPTVPHHHLATASPSI